MRKNFIYGILTVLVAVIAFPSKAQYMPVVFDKQYGEGGTIAAVAQKDGGEIIMAASDRNQFRIAWLDPMGNIEASRPIAGYVDIRVLRPLTDGSVLIAGQSGVKRNRIRNSVSLCGRMTIIAPDGRFIRDVYVGGQGSALLHAELLPGGAVILGGYELKPNGDKRGFVTRVDAQDRDVYQFTPVNGDVCAALEVSGADGETVYAAFSSENNDGSASVVRLDGRGKPYFATALPAEDLKIRAMAKDISDGSVVVIGESEFAGGIAYKLRAEGDIVFSKTIVPASSEVTCEHLLVARNGNILVGGSSDRGYYALMRNDGTSLQSGVLSGRIGGMGMNPVSGEAAITSFGNGQGAFLRFNAAGKLTAQMPLNGKFDQLKIDNMGDVLLVSSSEGRVCMISSLGSRLFDRYVTENTPEIYEQALLIPSGEIVFVGADNRMVKMGHGLYVSDVKITKPVNGYATALFTVTLTGYATTAEGAPIPVSVDYATRERSATETANYTPVSGKISFAPAGGGANRFLVKQDIEVPIKSNDRIEGSKEFDLVLSNVKQSYLVKSTGRGLIEDQQAVVRMVSATDGVEASKDIVYQLGLFKTDGTPLVNVTGTNIVLDGNYGKGTADALDFDMGRIPRAVFAPGSHTASFNVRTLSDTRYELPKSVVVNFDKIHALSSSNVTFDGALLTCAGTVVDQPAVISIASLGDHSRINNNVVSGFFSVSLRRASDGALLTNATGGDIVIDCRAQADGSAQAGTDFVLTNQHNLRIEGTGRNSAANLNGIVLYSPDKKPKTVRVAIEGVQSPVGAQPVTVAADGRVAEFTILN